MIDFLYFLKIIRNDIEKQIITSQLIWQGKNLKFH